MMKISRSISVVVLATLILGNVVFAQASRTGAQVQSQLVQSLPASDAVVSFNANKFLNIALPQLMGADSPKLAQINGKIDEIKDRTGLDLRQFEQAAVGIRYKKISATETDFEPVILAQGKFNASAMLALVKLAAKGKYREERVGEKSVYVLQMAELIAEAQQGKQTSSTIEQMISKVLRTFSGELAVGALNTSTLTIGSLERVKETMSGTSKVNTELKTSALASPTAILSFSGNMPAGFTQMIGFGALDNDEITTLLNSVKAVDGYLDMNGSNALLMVGAKTSSVKQAMDLEDMAVGLQSLGKALIGTVKGSEQDKQMYARLIESAKISRVGTKVKMNLSILQSDLTLLGKKL